MNETTKFISTLMEDKDGIQHWTNKNTENNINCYDSYIDGIFYPTPYLYQGGNSEGLKDKLMEMELDYKGLNKIWRGFGEYCDLSKKLNIEQLVNIIVIRTLAKVNSWVLTVGKNGKWTVIKPYN